MGVAQELMLLVVSNIFSIVVLVFAHVGLSGAEQFIIFGALYDTLHDIHSSHMSNASVHTLHMPKPNVTRVQSATERTASVHTLHMPKPNVTRVQSATQWTASIHTLHMPKPNVTRVQSATQKETCGQPWQNSSTESRKRGSKKPSAANSGVTLFFHCHVSFPGV